MTIQRRALLAGFLLLAARVGALENVFLVSDTVGYFERAFAVRGRSTAWFTNAGKSTLRYRFPGKGDVSFRLAEPPAGGRYVDQVQVEPAGGALTMEQAAAFAAYVVNDLSRTANAACSPLRDDQDGLNAFIIHSCADKAAPSAPPLQVSVTIQTVGDRRLIFVEFGPKKN
jgi:hypothetical protein